MEGVSSIRMPLAGGSLGQHGHRIDCMGGRVRGALFAWYVLCAARGHS